jgi:hypothetical protein
MLHDDLAQARRHELNLRRGFDVRSYRESAAAIGWHDGPVSAPCACRVRLVA